MSKDVCTTAATVGRQEEKPSHAWNCPPFQWPSFHFIRVMRIIPRSSGVLWQFVAARPLHRRLIQNFLFSHGGNLMLTMDYHLSNFYYMNVEFPCREIWSSSKIISPLSPVDPLLNCITVQMALHSVWEQHCFRPSLYREIKTGYIMFHYYAGSKRVFTTMSLSVSQDFLPVKSFPTVSKVIARPFFG